MSILLAARLFITGSNHAGFIDRNVALAGGILQDAPPSTPPRS
jgi:hypothetical protein